MAANVSDSLSLLSSEGEAVRLPDGGVVIGILEDVIEPDQRDSVLVCINGHVIEVPSCLSAQLWKMIGQRVVLAKVGGEHLAALSSL